MLGFLAQSNPALYDILDVGMTEVKQLDATYSFRFRDDREAEKVLALMRNVSTQHIRKSTKDAMFKNTLYFGSERCKRFARKVYVKSNEFPGTTTGTNQACEANDKCAQLLRSCPILNYRPLHVVY